MNKIKNVQCKIYTKRSKHTATSANYFADLNIFDE